MREGRRPTGLLVLALALTVAGCGQDDDPDGARILWAKINAAPGFKSWARAPGHATRMPSFTAHSRAVDIYVSREISVALGDSSVREWPVGSVVVKEGFSGDSRELVAVMEKRADGWFWAEYNDSGESLFSGRPGVCIDCHDNRKSYSDWIYAFELPR